MADLKVKINDPILVGTQFFKVRYRLLPAGSWVDISPKTNAQFTVLGLSAGTYQFEFIVSEDGVDCPAVYKEIEVTEFECLPFTVEQQLSPYGIVVSYTGTDPLPPCGWYVSISAIPNTGSASTFYQVLPASPFFIPVSGNPQDLHVKIQANTCGDFEFCFDEDVLKPEPSICTPMSGLSGTVQLRDTGTAQNVYSLNITGTQSNPVTTNPTIIVTQAGTSGAVQKWTGTFTPTGVGSPVNMTFTIYYNNHSPAQTISWIVTVIDICGKSHSFSVTA